MSDLVDLNAAWMRASQLGEGIDLSPEHLSLLIATCAGKLFEMLAHDDEPEPAIPAACASCDPFIYFLQAESGGPIKIGLTTNPVARRTEHQTSHPEQLRYIALVRAPAHFERTLHKHFEPEWLRGEWHHPSPRLLRFCRKVGVQ